MKAKIASMVLCIALVCEMAQVGLAQGEEGAISARRESPISGLLMCIDSYCLGMPRALEGFSLAFVNSLFSCCLNPCCIPCSIVYLSIYIMIVALIDGGMYNTISIVMAVLEAMCGSSIFCDAIACTPALFASVQSCAGFLVGQCAGLLTNEGAE